MPHTLVQSLAPAFNALAFCDIQNQFGLTVPAVNRQVSSLRLRLYAEQAVIPPTHRADDPSIPYDKFSSFLIELQPYFPSPMRSYTLPQA